ncbi:recombinase family protein [Clostridium sp. NSJ-145]|uniref:recombinase family protein n=1 Tax=Clostridium sp. NSJ-145 TaxID=2897777 RepID=UPI001E2DB12B|nr:recombinase family protein [Clostridium sp. NSJ-145]MCD2503336.1 recombinase family protein [Clostridium sp. NSJ-145]
MIFGYARISTTKDSQTTQRQLLALDQYAKSNNFIFDEIIEERVSGTINAENRQEYSKLKSKLRLDDILVLTDLDRLGRNADNVIMELKDLKSRGIRVIALDMPYMCDWDKVTDNSIYDMVIDIVITIKAHIAQQERDKIVSRINQGLEVARTTGKTLGRPKAELPKEFIKEYTKFKDGHYGNMTSTGLAKMLGIGRSTLYKYIKLYKNK